MYLVSIPSQLRYVEQLGSTWLHNEFDVDIDGWNMLERDSLAYFLYISIAASHI